MCCQGQCTGLDQIETFVMKWKLWRKCTARVDCYLVQTSSAVTFTMSEQFRRFVSLLKVINIRLFPKLQFITVSSYIMLLITLLQGPATYYSYNLRKIRESNDFNFFESIKVAVEEQRFQNNKRRRTVEFWYKTLFWSWDQTSNSEWKIRFWMWEN